MLAIKLSRTGKKSYPYFRIVILEKTKDPWGRILENLGNYNPRTKELVLNEERIKYWLGLGAQPTTTVFNLFVAKGLVSGHKKRASRISKRRQEKLDQKAKVEEKPAPVAPAEAKVEKSQPEEVKPVEVATPVEAKPEETTAPQA